MTELEIIDSCRNLLVTNIYEPKQNQLSIEIIIGKESETKEEIFIGNKSLSGRRIIFDNSSDKYLLSFASYISYLVINESYDIGMSGEYSGDRIREYKHSAFIDFCKKETNGFFLNEENVIRHFVLVTQNHIVNILTTSSLKVKSID